MKRFDELEELCEHIWKYCHDAVRFRDNAMSTPVFATTGPGARTVALRRCEPEERMLAFHTDRRSRKVGQLRENPRAIWLAWDREIKQQFQLLGETSLHFDDAFADAVWEGERDEELVFYFKTEPPGVSVEGPASGMDFSNTTEEGARKNFVAVRTIVDELIWQHLHPEGEYRARFVWDGERFVGEWILP